MVQWRSNGAFACKGSKFGDSAYVLSMSGENFNIFCILGIFTKFFRKLEKVRKAAFSRKMRGGEIFLLQLNLLNKKIFGAKPQANFFMVFCEKWVSGC